MFSLLSKYLVPVLAVAAMLTGGIGIAYAGSQGAGDGGEPTASMMGGDMASMMGRGSSNMQAMGSFDEYKPFDLQFIDQMTMHHEGAIMSAKSMVSDSGRPELRKLAADIEKSQSEQIHQMQEFRKEWYPAAKQTFGMPPGAMSRIMGGDSIQAMMGTSMQDVMGGGMTDAMFLRMMIPHHQMAVGMAQKALKDAQHPQLKDLARKIEDEQSAEIRQMQGYLEDVEKDGGIGSMMGNGMMGSTGPGNK